MPAAQLVGLDLPLAERFARTAIDNIGREYPNAPGHLLAGPAELRPPHELHPAFFGSYDWHSCVHQHWLLVRLLRRVPGLPAAADARTALGATLTAENLAVEAAYLADPARATFERTYGWAWLLELGRELGTWDDPDGRSWAEALRPLADVVVARWLDFLPRATYPIRAGTHANSAFGLAFAFDHARACGRPDLATAVEAAARRWFLADRDYPANYEPSGDDFLSGALTEAALLARILAPGAFAGWLKEFLPGLAAGGPVTILEPAVVSDRADAKLVHLDGLNLSRAWGWSEVAGGLPAGDARVAIAEAAAARHLAAGMEGIGRGEYVGDHWLGSFAVLALTGADSSGTLCTSAQ